MSDDLIYLDKINKRYAKLNICLSKMVEFITTIVQNDFPITQEKIEEFSQLIEKYDLAEEYMRETLKSILRDIIEEDNQEVEGIQTNKGFEL
ncbi:MAG: hypothetical protein ACOC5T_03530 [Elusimicrobiota bacterium]